MKPPHLVLQRLAMAALDSRGLALPAHAITLGSITLLPHQASAVRWLHHRISRLGGALLADPPGLGKTYVALAVAAARRHRPLVIAPAALRTRWRDAARETEVPIDFVSTECLSAPARTDIPRPAFVIIDEAHHLRTAGTRRHQRTIALCLHAEVLLLTATPIHNRSSDLARITTLFHLPPTRQTPATLRHLTLRRTPAQIHAAGIATGTGLALPAVVNRPAPRLPTRDTPLPAAILALPAVQHDAGDGHALLQLGILHALRSSDAAAHERIRHRIAACIAIESAARANIAATPILRRAWRSIGG
ncbi:MAG TPA: SNF2-related protein, partial [Gemmatimonadaceae bacterium]|nr:SNF2-related protein [Gemmatimonadaceae bacterium]